MGNFEAEQLLCAYEKKKWQHFFPQKNKKDESGIFLSLFLLMDKAMKWCFFLYVIRRSESGMFINKLYIYG